jgi:hypothetical protein
MYPLGHTLTGFFLLATNGPLHHITHQFRYDDNAESLIVVDPNEAW